MALKKMSYTELAATANYDEAKVPKYKLPSALDRPEGGRVKTAFEWANTQRGNVYKLFEEHMYGTLPRRPDEMKFELLSRKDDALGGIAVRKEIRIHCLVKGGLSHHFDMLLYTPKEAKGPVPAFAGLNFWGNHAASPENDVRETRHKRSGEIKERGWNASAWQIEKIVRRGYALATTHYFDIYPDTPEGLPDSIYKLFKEERDASKCPGGAISAWAWGLGRMLDCLEAEPSVDASKVAVFGHSRLGKTALWAGASDRRFGMVISNNSGCGGAALSRRRFGETFALINAPVSYWFTPGFVKYSDREDDMPVDQHMLIGLAAPRPAYAASATEDLWADPKGEFLSTALAAEVYKLFGSQGLGTMEMPPPDTPISGDLGYHLRTGKHEVAEYDWECYLSFADKHFRQTP